MISQIANEFFPVWEITENAISISDLGIGRNKKQICELSEKDSNL